MQSQADFLTPCYAGVKIVQKIYGPLFETITVTVGSSQANLPPTENVTKAVNQEVQNAEQANQASSSVASPDTSKRGVIVPVRVFRDEQVSSRCSHSL